MPWISEQADCISWDRIEAILQQTVAEARTRICATPSASLWSTRERLYDRATGFNQ